MRRVVSGLKAAVALTAVAAACGAVSAPADEAAYAVVDGTVITVQEVESAVAGAVGQRYYHRRPRDEQLADLKREVSEGLVNRVVLLNEARRRGIEPDSGKVRAAVANYRRRVSDAAQWERLLPDVTRALEEQSIVAKLEAEIRSVGDPDESKLHGYYASRADMFTEPERVRVSVILLKVPPSSPQDTWDDAAARAAGIVRKLGAGEDFAALARAHSQDDSARSGGDAGYIHRGMLPGHVEEILDRLEPGSLSEPLRVLEGVAIFRLAERRPAYLKPFTEARARVLDLWRREEGDTRWRDFIAALREKSTITIATPVSATAAGHARERR